MFFKIFAQKAEKEHDPQRYSLMYSVILTAAGMYSFSTKDPEATAREELRPDIFLEKRD